MKLSKVLLVMVLLSFLVIPLSSYALKEPTADTFEAQQAAEAQVKKTGEGEKLASNMDMAFLKQEERIVERLKSDINPSDTADSTISPLLFSDAFAVNNTQEFAAAVSAMQPDQVAVIIAITMNADDIRKAIDGKVSLAKVVIVQATTRDSQESFNTLFEEYKEGFSLKDVGRNNPVAVKALQGAV